MIDDIKRDSLGRRIPQFDRKAAAAKAQKTREERFGTNFNATIGAIGGSQQTRGYLGYLRDTDPDKLKKIAKDAAAKSVASRAAKKSVHTDKE